MVDPNSETFASDPGRRAEATRILSALTAGDAAEAEALLSLVYDELRGLASGYLKSERADHTLQPTALAHEAWMRLVDQSRVQWQGRAHFLAVAAQAMRRILVDHARSKQRQKRGGAWQRVELDPELVQTAESFDLVALDAALERLKELDARQAQVVELRFFAGLPVKEVAEVLDVSIGTIERDWRFASAWLAATLRGST